MTCDRERLSAYLDGELSFEEVRELREHLASCERCTADLAAYREVDDSIGRLAHRRAPSDLRRAVYQRIDERRARTRVGWAWSLLAPAVPLTVTFALVAGSVIVWRQMPPGAAPVMTAAFAVQETPESLDGLRVELVFDRPVAADSLIQAVSVEPYVPMTQRVHENKVELIPQVSLPSGSSYKVIVNNVRDQRGNVQSEPVVLNLTAGPTATLVQESSPVAPDPPPAPKAAAPAAPAASSVGSAPAPNAPSMPQTAPSPPPASQPAAPAAAVPVAAAPALAPTSAARPAVTPVTATPAPTSAVAARPPAGPAQAAAAAGQSATGAQASAAGAASASAPPAAAPNLAMTAARGTPSLLDGNPELQRKLGPPGGPERAVQLGEQTFQGGAMLTRSDTNQVYALVRSTGRWTSFANTWRPGEVLAPVGTTRPPGTWEPMRAIGKTWRDQPAVKLQLGWAVYEERNAPGSAQVFENGTLLRSSFGVAYALFNDATWRTLPDPRH